MAKSISLSDGQSDVHKRSDTDHIVEAMVHVPGGTFTMGSSHFYPEEAPPRTVKVSSFWMDAAPVTNRQFMQFVNETAYMTLAELCPDPADYPGITPELCQPGSLVFQKSDGPVDLSRSELWWDFVFGANWRAPFGPGSSIVGLDDHPVVHVSYADALAYAEWSGKALPTEAEFEFAARGGLERADYAWGDQLAPDDQIMANYWIGDFPYRRSGGVEGPYTTSVGSYPANDYGIYDLIGNVWEWTEDWWSDGRRKTGKNPKSNCCVARNPRGGSISGSYDLSMPDVNIGRKVIKGGSHLCSEIYCRRYRPAARQPQMIDSSTSHLGFRCVVRRER